MGESGEPDRLNAPAAAAIRAALQRVLAADPFRGAPQLQAFLSFIVESAIVGRGSELKGYTIAVEALGRAPDFDPQSDPIVRVEAGRLRKALAQYYAGEGARDPVRLSMPVGAYVPVFAFSEDALDEPEPLAETADALSEVEAGVVLPAASDVAVSRRWLTLAGIALAAGLASLGLWYRLNPAQQVLPAAPAQPSAALAETIARPASMPVQLPVLAIRVGELPPDPELAEIARRASSLLADAIARFDDLVTVKAPGDPRADTEGANYVFEMSATRFGATTEAVARLRAVADGRIVWTASTNRLPVQSADDHELPEIARRLAIRLAEPFGIIHADFRQSASSPAMRCIFEALDFRRTMKAEDHLAARTCLEGLLDRDPNFHPAWSQLAFLILDEYTSGLNPLPGPPLDRALSAALNAVRLSPSSARANQAMMDVLFARGQTTEALAAGREAMARNPYDPTIMADLGARYVQLNRPAEGLPLLERAVGLSTGRPSWYDFFAFLAARLTGDTALAETHVARLLADEGPFSLLGRAMQCAVTGDQIGLTTAVASLTEMSPLFRLDPRLFLERKGFGAAVVERIMADLGPATIDLLKPR